MSIYMKAQGISGSATDLKHKNWIELDAINFSTNRRVRNKIGSGQSRDVAMPSIGSLSVTKMADKSSPSLLQKMLQGKAIETVTIEVCQTSNDGVTPYARYNLSNVIISHYEDDTLAHDAGIGQEYLILSFTNLQKTFIAHNPQGNASSPVTIGYNLETAKAS